LDEGSNPSDSTKKALFSKEGFFCGPVLGY